MGKYNSLVFKTAAFHVHSNHPSPKTSGSPPFVPCVLLGSRQQTLENNDKEMELVRQLSRLKGTEALLTSSFETTVGGDGGTLGHGFDGLKDPHGPGESGPVRGEDS